MPDHSTSAREVWVEATASEPGNGEQQRARATRDRSLFVNIRLLSQMLADKGFRVPPKLLLYFLGAVLYFISPIDLVPDFIPGLGYIDDAVVIGLMLRSLNEVLNAYRAYRGID